MATCEKCKQEVEQRIFALMKAAIDSSKAADAEMGIDPESEDSNTSHAKTQGFILYEILYWLRDDKIPVTIEIANDLSEATR